MKTGNLKVAIISVVMAVAMGASAQITLTYNGVNPGEDITIQSSGAISFGPELAAAGIYNSTVDGVPTQTFCIDVFRDITVGETFTDYSYTNLSSAPLSPAGPMGAAAAVDISKLWAAYFPAASVGNQAAAALQVAIWEDISQQVGTYTLTFSGNTPVTTEAAAMLASLPTLTAQANLEALVSPDGQGFVVPVPEPTTAGCFLLGLGVLVFHRRFRKNERV